jgi:hypothetical protein
VDGNKIQNSKIHIDNSSRVIVVSWEPRREPRSDSSGQTSGDACAAQANAEASGTIALAAERPVEYLTPDEAWVLGCALCEHARDRGVTQESLENV